jgi:hypothetical protein
LLEKLAQSYGRIAAQAAKQNLIQRLRDAERDIIYNEFKDRKGELTHSGIVQRFEKKNIIVNLGRTDAILPRRSRSRASAIGRATAFAPSSSTSRWAARARRSCCPARIPAS